MLRLHLGMPAIARRLFGARGIRGSVALAVAAATLAVPASALAVDAPTIVSAGIDPADRPYVTWRVGAGTTYDHAEFATAPTVDPDVQDSFLDANLVAFGCIDTPGVCTGTAQSTSLNIDYAVTRDRRYFVKVAATIDGSRDVMVSAVWVIDAAKPLIPGQPPAFAEGPPTNTPAVGAPLAGSFAMMVIQAGAPGPVEPPGLDSGISDGSVPGGPQPQAGAQAGATVSLLALPKTIAAVLARGVRVRVTCPRAPCATTASLMLGATALAGKRVRMTRAGTQTLVLKPKGAARRRLRSRPRARLRVKAAVMAQGSPVKQISRSFVVRGRRAARR